MSQWGLLSDWLKNEPLNEAEPMSLLQPQTMDGFARPVWASPRDVLTDTREENCFPFLFIYLFNFTVLYWFCHTSTWIHHGCTRVPHHEPPSVRGMWGWKERAVEVVPRGNSRRKRDAETTGSGRGAEIQREGSGWVCFHSLPCLLPWAAKSRLSAYWLKLVFF